jgi:hypothetical protein
MIILFRLFRLIWKLIWSTIVVLVCLSLIFILYKGNQPMQVRLLLDLPPQNWSKK